MSGAYDLAVLGAGPAGQKAALQAAKAGARALLIERAAAVGGECVQRGTIPSKTLRETALFLSGLRHRAPELVPQGFAPHEALRSLRRRVVEVQAAHERYLGDQIARNGVELWRGRGRIVAPGELEVALLDGTVRRVSARAIVIATGSRPRRPDGIEVDHERVLDSDSILDLAWLPHSLAVLGSGVIACEFATLFQALGVAVALVDRSPRPLAFLDPEIAAELVRHFEAAGGSYVAGARAAAVERDGLAGVRVRLEDGRELRAEKALVALGRSPCLEGLGLERLGLAPGPRGWLEVDEHCATAVPGIYAAGDAIGPPALAAAAMEQGRRAARHALGLPASSASEVLPIGIYTIPELAGVGLSEAEARARHGSALVGRARFAEVARGLIDGEPDGLLKLVCDGRGERVLGAQVAGAGAAELVHLAQLAMLGGLPVDTFVDHVFNFPTRAEAYRVAALDVVGQRARLAAA